MLNKILIAVVALVALITGFASGVLPGNIGGLILCLAGLVYGWVAVDAEDSVQFLAVAIAVGAASGADALGAIPAIGAQLNAAVGAIGMALYASVASVLVARMISRLKG